MGVREKSEIFDLDNHKIFIAAALPMYRAIILIEVMYILAAVLQRRRGVTAVSAEYPPGYIPVRVAEERIPVGGLSTG